MFNETSCVPVGGVGQRDFLFDIYWTINIGLFSIAGFAMVTAQERPCYFGAKLFTHALIGLDVVTWLMFLYSYLYTGCTTRDWNKLKFFIVRILVIQGVPFACLLALAYHVEICNAAFCDESETLGTFLYMTAAIWEVVMQAFGTATLIHVRNRCDCCRKRFYSNESLHVGNYVERYALLTILCIGECVVALT